MAFGPCAANPEPLAEFIDIFVLGEPEEALVELMEIVAETKAEGADRAEVLRRAFLLPGVYAPSCYSVSYKADGSLEAIAAIRGAADSVHKRMLDSLGPAAASPVVPFLEVADDPGMVEIQRGCGPGCPQCETGSACGLVRQRSVANVMEVIDGLVHKCGYQDVRLLWSGAPELSVLEQAVRAVRARYSAEDLSLTLPDMPLGDQSIAVAQLLADGAKRRGYALEPIAATDRLRESIGRTPCSRGALVRRRGIVQTWLGRDQAYRFTIGLPTETMDDVRAIVGLVVETQRIGQRVLGKRPRVRVAVSIFTPKPHTLLQRVGQETSESLEEKLDLLRLGLKKAGAPAPLPEPAPSLVEAVLGPRGSACRQGRASGLGIGVHLRCLEPALRLRQMASGLGGERAVPCVLRPTLPGRRGAVALGPPGFQPGGTLGPKGPQSRHTAGRIPQVVPRHGFVRLLRARPPSAGSPGGAFAHLRRARNDM